MSVGHVQRGIEAAGIPSVSISVAAFGHVPDQMALSRALITDHPMGRPLGAPGDHNRHLAVVSSALELIDQATARTIERFPLPYRTWPM